VTLSQELECIIEEVIKLAFIPAENYMDRQVQCRPVLKILATEEISDR